MRYSSVILLLLISMFVNQSACAENVNLKLTPEEKAWIKAHPELTVANEADWPPFDYTVENRPAGYSIDVVRLIGQKTGLKIKFINGYSWKELLQQFKQGKIDLLPALFINEKRKKYISFSHSYYSQPSVMVVHKDNKDISNISNLENKRVAGVEGYSFTTSIKKIEPTVSIIRVKNILEGLKAVSLGKADAFVDSIGTVSYILENNYIPNLKIISDIKHAYLDNPAIHMGVAKNNTILVSILNKAISSISRDEKYALSKIWFYQQERQTIKFSPEQQDWLSQHSKIRIGIMNAWPPMDYVDMNGEPKGIGVKYIVALNKRLGHRLEIVPGLWKDNFKAIKGKKLDALMDITPRPDREKFVHFTKPYIEVPHLIYTRKGEPPKTDLSDLKYKKVAIEKDFFINKVLKAKYPEVEVKEYNTSSDALDALSKGAADAYIGNRAVANYIIENELIKNVIAQGKIKETSSVNAIAVRKDWSILRDILQKGLDDIDPAERSSIINPDRHQKELINLKQKLIKLLTGKERAWLNKKIKLHLGVEAGWPPVEWIDRNGIYQGMTSDYIKFISGVSGLNFVNPDKMAWTEVLQGAQEKKIDVLTAVVDTPKRRKYLTFTSPYLKFPFVVFTRNDASLVTDLSDIYGKRVGIEDGYSARDELLNDHPELNFVSYKNTKDILHALSVGDIDAYVGNLTVAVYLLNQEGLTNIKVAAPTKYNFELSLGVRKDLPELRSVLEKTLSLISEEKRNEIRQHWLNLHYKVGVDYELVIKIVFVVAVIMLFIFTWFFVVLRQKKLLRLAKEKTEEANERLKELDKLKSMFIASVSHELRTPLTSIIGFSGLIMDDVKGELKELYQEYGTNINKSGEHLLSLITDILDISKIESGNFDVEISDFELHEIIYDSAVNIKQLAESKNLKIVLNVESGISLHTDRRRLFQCVLNFVSNAVKYSEQGEVNVSAKDLGEMIEVKVKDTGVGICEDDMQRLFEPFERFESRISVKAGGTGLGLYLTKKIVMDMLQGEVGAESKIGEGSTFWLKIPKSI